MRRLALSAPLLVVVSGLSFLLVSLTPGDAAIQILGFQYTPERGADLRHALQLDLPLYDQYWRWVTHAFQGNLGASLYNGEAVSKAITERLPVTLSLMGGSLLLSVIGGVGLGVLSAVRGGAVGRSLDALAMTGWVLPSFWIGAELIELFAVKLRWFPASGYVAFAESPGQWLRSLALPVVALALGGIAVLAKQTREAMLDVMGSEYIRMARANGIPARSIIFRHALKNAGLRVLTITGVLTVGLIGGTVFAENVFALPGLGSLVVSASLQHDLPLVQGVAVVITAMVVVINLVTDIAYSWLNPKVRTL